MPTKLVWRSSRQGLLDKTAPKILDIALATPLLPERVMDAATTAIQAMNLGRLWSDFSKRPLPEGGPEAVEVRAVAKYSGSQDRMPSSRIGLQLVCQKAISIQQVALHMTFIDQPSVGAVLPWGDSISESIVALTALQVRSGILQQLFGLPLTNPISNWTWSSGAWFHPQEVQFGDWLIELSR